MKINTRLTIAAFVPAVMAVFIGLALLVSHFTLLKVGQNRESARDIIESANELTMLVTEYALYHGERPKAQFLEVHAVVSRTIADTHLDKEEQRRLLGTIRTNADAMKRLFLRLIENVDNAGEGGGEIPEGVSAHLTGQLVVRSRQVAADATRLEILVNDDMARSRRQTTGAIALAIVLTAVPLTLLLVRTRKNITLSLDTLRKGTEAVSRGDLDHSVQVNVDDEVGDVSHAFNRMTAELKNVTASREELQAEIVERVRAETEFQIVQTFLEIANINIGLQGLLDQFVSALRHLTGCEAVGIRLLDKDGSIPYSAYRGFSDEFYESESPLSLKTDRCMCINVIAGTTDPALPFYTANGSFYMNGTTRFLATVSENEKGVTRNTCNRMGYESVALIPVRASNRIIGLIHLADPKEEMVPQHMVTLMEKIGSTLGVGIQRALAEKEVAESERRYRTLFESMNEGFALHEIVLDEDRKPRDFRFLDVNPAFERHTRLKASEVVGRTLYEVLPESESVWLDEYSRVVLTGEPVHFDHWSAPLSRHYQVSAFRTEPGRFGVVFLDVTARKKAEDALKMARTDLERRVMERTAELQRAYEQVLEQTRERERLEEQLRQAQKMEAIGTLAGGIAHDFNNMLAVIIGNTELALDDLTENEAPRRNLEAVIRASKRCRDLVKQILTFSRKDTSQQKIQPLSPLMEESFRLLRASLPSTIEMRLHLGTTDDMARVNEAQFQQILMNLCTNAAYAMREKGGLLHISLEDEPLPPDGSFRPENPAYLKLTVSDTGTGMKEEVKKRVFDPFFTTKKVGEGTGMGLAVVYGIVEAHNGLITVLSEPGKGSTFAVFLPRAEGTAIGTEPGEQAVTGGQERILFIDDEESLADMAQVMLGRLGYAVRSFTDSQDALDTFTLTPQDFDLIITDQTMPKMTGVTLARRVKSIRPDIPVMLCTGYSQTISPEEAALRGIDGFLMKPLVKKEMAEAIRRILDQR